MIRFARDEDAPRIADIQNVIIRDTAITFNSLEKSPFEIRAAIAELPCFMVAELDGDVVGFASYLPFRRGIGYGRTMEHSIVLAPDARGQGFGRKLMTAIEDHATAAGVGSMWAGVSGENPDGVKFHASLGYVEIAKLPRVGFKFGRWMDLHLMQKWLSGDADIARNETPPKAR